jgi:hypothetical protein
MERSDTHGELLAKVTGVARATDRLRHRQQCQRAATLLKNSPTKSRYCVR